VQLTRSETGEAEDSPETWRGGRGGRLSPPRGPLPLGTSSGLDQRTDVEIIETHQLQVDQRVVVTAEETEVGDDGLTAVSPGHDVMNVAPPGGSSASGGYTVPVAGDDGTS
jgi:hypothetical protein